MATSGSSSVTVATASNGEVAVTLQLNWSVNWQSAATNRSSVHFELRVITGRYGAMSGSASKTWDIWANGTRVNAGTWSIGMGANQNRLIGYGDIEIPHNTDGTKSFELAATAQFNMNFNGWRGSYTVRYNATLNTIPRASTPSVGTARTIGSAITINTNRASSSFTHTLTYQFGSASGTIATGVGASTNWTPPMSLCNQIPNATNGTLTITCVTYSGGTNVGTKTTSVSLSVPSSVVPSFTASSITDSKGYLSTYGAFVQGKSTAVANATAAGSYGSTIKSYSVSLDGLSASASGSGAKSMTLGAPPTAGNRTVTLKATDSRNRSITGTKAITVAAYVKPSISNLSCDRYDTGAGKYDDEATTIRTVFSYSAHDVNSAGVNRATVKIEWKEVSASSWTTAYNAQQSALTGSITYDLTGKSSAQSFDIRVTVTDSFGESYQLSRQVGTAEPVMDFKDGGKGIGIGRVSLEDGVVDVGFDLRTRGEFQSYGLMSGIRARGNVSEDKYILLARATGASQNEEAPGASVNWGGNLGWIRIEGKGGGWTAGNSGAVDILIHTRDFSPAQVEVLTLATDVSTYNFDIIVRRVRNQVSIYLKVRSYYFYDLMLSGFQVEVLNQAVEQMEDADSASFNWQLSSNTSVKCLAIFPVGSIVIRYDHISPASIYGGTWARISSTFLYATGSTGNIGATGGSSTHTLTTAQMPSHNHGLPAHTWGWGAQSGSGTKLGVSGVENVYQGGPNTSNSLATIQNVYNITNSTGSGSAHNNNPYFTNVSVWRRTA